jgi:hypothetical protein
MYGIKVFIQSLAWLFISSFIAYFIVNASVFPLYMKPKSILFILYIYIGGLQHFSYGLALLFPAMCFLHYNQKYNIFIWTLAGTLSGAISYHIKYVIFIRNQKSMNVDIANSSWVKSANDFYGLLSLEAVMFCAITALLCRFFFKRAVERESQKIQEYLNTLEDSKEAQDHSASLRGEAEAIQPSNTPDR